MRNTQGLFSVSTLLVFVSLGCSGTSSTRPPDTSSTGGSTGTGGAEATTGGSTSTGGSSEATGGVTATGGSDMGGAAGEDGTAGAPGEAGTALHDKVFKITCDNASSTGNSCSIANADNRKFNETIAFGGNPATTYDVTLHFCGPFEPRQYMGCQAGPQGERICTDGMLFTDQYSPTYPTLAMKVSAPEHTYYLNSSSARDTILKLDYSATFPIQGGATVTFESDGGTNSGIYTAFLPNPDITCPNVPGIEQQPHPGQFVHVTVESVEPQ